MDGIIVVNKPAGITSYDVIRFVKRTFPLKEKIGHAGTLDPLAEGVLILCLGKATRLSQRFMDCEKEYVARLLLGIRTHTLDLEGTVLETRPVAVTEQQVRSVINSFRGEIEQIPPVISALKHKGQPLYKLYRKGVVIAPAPRRVMIHDIEITSLALPSVEFRVVCSKGTYIRALCRDIGDRLGCGGVQAALRRTRIGPFAVEGGWDLDRLKKQGLAEALLPVSRLLEIGKARPGINPAARA